MEKNKLELEKITLSRSISNYRRKLLLQNMLQACSQLKPKIYTGHTTKILYVQPQESQNLPRLKLISQNRTENSLRQDTQIEQYNLSPPKKPKIKRVQNQKHQKTDSMENQSKRLYFGSNRRYNLPQIDNQTLIISHFFSDKPEQNDPLSQFRRYNQKQQNQQNQQNQFNEPKMHFFKPQRPMTKNTKIFHHLLKEDFKQQIQDDQLSDIDNFHEYVNNQKF